MNSSFDVDSSSDRDELVFSESEQKDLAERQESVRDIYGGHDCDKNEDDAGNHIKKTPTEDETTALSRAREQLQHALNMLSPGPKNAYTEAMKMAPHVVETESNPDRFLKAHKMDPWAAAQNIGLYWEQRIEIFGPHRAFLPVDDLSGKGALSKEVVEGMKCGALMILPPDRHGRPVVVSDRNRVCAHCFQAHVRVQYVFYIYQILFGMDQALENGWVGVVLFNITRHNTVNPNPAPNCISFMRSGAIPVKVNAVHMCVLRMKRSFLEQTVPIFLKVFERWKFLSLRTVVHYSESQSKIMSDLKEYGILEDGIPLALGGLLDYDSYVKNWFKGKQEKKTVGRSSSTSFKAPPVAAGDSAVAATSGGNKSTVASTRGDAEIDEQKERKRKLDILYHRQKRQRQKEFVEQLKTQVEEAKREHIILKSQNDFLEAAHERALQAVEQHKKQERQQKQQAHAQHQEQLKGSVIHHLPAVARLPVLPAAEASESSRMDRFFVQQQQPSPPLAYAAQESLHHSGSLAGVLGAGFSAPPAASPTAESILVDRLRRDLTQQHLMRQQAGPVLMLREQQLLQQEHHRQQQQQLASLLLRANHVVEPGAPVGRQALLMGPSLGNTPAAAWGLSSGRTLGDHSQRAAALPPANSPAQEGILERLFRGGRPI